MADDVRIIFATNLRRHMNMQNKTQADMASLFAEQGIPLEVIQHRLGHSDSKTTREIYLHITERRKKMEHELIKNIAIF